MGTELQHPGQPLPASGAPQRGSARWRCPRQIRESISWVGRMIHQLLTPSGPKPARQPTLTNCRSPGVCPTANLDRGVEQGAQSDPSCAVCLAAVVHRLSQPLTALRGSLELALLREGTMAEYRQALEQSLEQADLLVQLISSLRELAEADTPGNVSEAVSLGEAALQALEEMRPLADSRRLSVSIESTSGIDVRADPLRLRHSILKILYCAIPRSPVGGTIRIALSTFREKALLHVTVKDQAASLKELSSLAERSTLGQLFRDASQGGALEWAIAKRLLEAQGGTVRAENQAEGKYRLSVWLPLASREKP